MSNRLLLALIAALVATLAALTLFWQPGGDRPPHGALPVAAAPTGGDFTLQSAAGPVSLASFRGRVVLLYFGYTYCPDICPTSLSATAQALASLAPAELAAVQTLFVSVDPERDTLERLKDYGAFFHPSIVSATGSPEQVAAVARLYGASYAKQTVAGSSNYVVDHSALTYVIAPDGRLVSTLPHGAAPAQVSAEIRKWLSTDPLGDRK